MDDDDDDDDDVDDDDDDDDDEVTNPFLSGIYYLASSLFEPLRLVLIHLVDGTAREFGLLLCHVLVLDCKGAHEGTWSGLSAKFSCLSFCGHEPWSRM